MNNVVGSMAARPAVVLIALVMLAGAAVDPILSRAAAPAAQAGIACGTLDPIQFGSVASAPSANATPEAASPVASPVAGLATPVAPAAGGSDDVAYIRALVEAITDCQSQRRPNTLTKLVTRDFLGQFYAGGGRLDETTFVELAKDFPRLSITVRSVSNVSVKDDGTATATVETVAGHQLVRATWSFIFREDGGADNTGHWLASGARAKTIEAPVGADEVKLTLDEYEYRPERIRADGPDVVIAAINRGDEDHEVLVLQLADGVETSALLLDPSPTFPRGVTMVGQVTVPAGEAVPLVLVDLEPGTYAIVDLLVDANGTPHLALGMEASLIVR